MAPNCLYLQRQVRRVDSVEGGSFIFWEVFCSVGGANMSAEGASLKGVSGGVPPPPSPTHTHQGIWQI